MHPARGLLAALVLAGLRARAHALVPLATSTLRCGNASAALSLHDASSAAQPARCADARGIYAARSSLQRTTYDNLTRPHLLSPLPPAGKCVDSRTACPAEPHANAFFTDQEYICVCAAGWFRPDAGSTCTRVPSDSGLVSPAHTDALFVCAPPSVAAGDACEATGAAAENGAYMGAYLLPPEPDARTQPAQPPPLHLYAAPPCAHAMRYNFTLQTCECAPGYVPAASTGVGCTLCPRDHYCPGGAQQHACARTLYAGAQRAGECVCAPGAYRAGNQAGGACVPVPANDTSTLVPACTRPEDSGVTCDVQVQGACPNNTRCAAGQVQPCPDGTYFDALAGASRCAACELGFWCRGGARRPCPANSSTLRVGAATVQQCRCARNYTRVAGLGHVHCRYAGAGGGVQQSLAPPPPPLADFGARLVHWHAEPPSAITAAALEHLALAPVRANHVRLHVHADARWRTLADLGLGDAALASTGNFSDLQVLPDTPAPGLLAVAFLHTDARLLQISLFRAEVNTSGANLTLARAHAPAILTARDPYANGTLVLPSPVRAALALLRCRRAPVFAERNVTRELPVFEVDSNGTQGNITNATVPVYVLETFELGRPRVCTLTLYALAATLDSAPRREVVLATDTDAAHVRWHADGRRLCVNATHYVDAESALLAAWAAPDACTPLPRSTPEPDARDGAAAPEACTAPLVRVGELCTACPANHTCDAAGRIAPCPPNALTVAQDATRCVCGGGAFLHSAERGCVPVPAGGYSGANDARLHACPQNTTSARGAASKHACQCLAGFYRDAETRQCAACAHGTYQPALNQSTCLPCPGAPAQVTTARTASTSAAACVCAAGFYGTPDAGCAPCTQLPAGAACLQATARVQDAVQCPSTARPAANANRTRCVCAPGTYLLGEVCHACGFGWFCDETQGIARRQCPRGTQTARALATSDAECECTAPGTTVAWAGGERRCVCDGGAGYYDVGGRCARCPPNSCTARTGCDCLRDCKPGYHTDAAGVCRLCAPGSYCSGLHGERARLCPRGTYGVIEGQSRLRDCVPCTPGVVLEKGEEARPHHPPHLACAGELVGIEGSALEALPAAPAVLWQAQGREATSTAATAASVAAAADKLAFVLRSPNVTQAFASRSHAGQLRVSARAHPGFAASLFAALQGAPEPWAEWVALHGLLAARHDRHAAVAQFLFCALLWHELQHAWEPGAASVRCEAEADAGAALPEEVRRAAREAVRAALNIVLAEDPHARLEAIPELSVLRELLQAQLGAQSADHVHLSVVAGRVVVTWSDAAASAPALLRAASFWRTIEPMLTVTGLALGGDACGVLPPDELAHIPAAAGQLVCKRCRPGREFRDAATGLCVGCTLATSACREDAYAFRPCSATGDAECVQVQAERQADTCGTDGRHTLDEECDFTDADSPLQSCCTMECTLKRGYYAFPNCSTICGDNIVAEGVEECDEISRECDLRTCRYMQFL
jgi:hypothetical protein